MKVIAVKNIEHAEQHLQSCAASSRLPSDWLTGPLSDVVRATPVQRLTWPDAERYGVEVWCKRDDMLHPYLSGNKFYKLHGHLRLFFNSSFRTLVSFGGPYSNHLYALAAAGAELGIATVAIVRGERPSAVAPTLNDLERLGMRLIFVSRADYRRRTDPVWVTKLCADQGIDRPYVVLEGGGGEVGAAGCVDWGRETLAMCPLPPDRVCIAAGTGTTAAGLSVALAGLDLHAFLALRGSAAEVDEFRADIHSVRERLGAGTSRLNAPLGDVVLETNYHCGGYAKFPAALRSFVERFETQTGMLLDPVYTAKLFWGVWHKLSSGAWSDTRRILVFHSGGLQGRRGMSMRPAL